MVVDTKYWSKFVYLCPECNLPWQSDKEALGCCIKPRAGYLCSVCDHFYFSVIDADECCKNRKVK